MLRAHETDAVEAESAELWGAVKIGAVVFVVPLIAGLVWLLWH